MKTTKEELLNRNTILAERVKTLEEADKKLRDTFAELLDQTEINSNTYSYGKVNILDCSWYKIAFLIGELKADADFSCILEARDTLKRENQSLYERIDELMEPKLSHD